MQDLEMSFQDPVRCKEREGADAECYRHFSRLKILTNVFKELI